MPQFKNNSGVYYTNALFWERTLDKSTAVYTLKENDHNGYPSLYKGYMDANDPTEYRFALQYLDGWQHWETLCDCSWFKPYLSRWRRELELRTRSEALLRVREVAANTTAKDSLTANRFLLQGGWKEAPTTKRGAPTKQQIKDAAHNIASTDKSLEDDFNRISGVVN